MKLKFEIEVWGTKLNFEVEVLSWSLKMKFKDEVWRWSLKLAFEVWSIKLKFEVEVWRLQLEIADDVANWSQLPRTLGLVGLNVKLKSIGEIELVIQSWTYKLQFGVGVCILS